MRFPRWLRRLPPAILILLASPIGGCLITDPILPLDPGTTNQPPYWAPGRPQPDPSSTLIYPPGSTQIIVFDAAALDPETAAQNLNYVWFLDGQPVQNHAGASEYSTTPATLGPGQHTLNVSVTDTGTPQQALFATWHINVQ